MAEERLQLNIRLDPVIRKRLKVRAAQEERTVQEIVIESIKAHLATPLKRD